MASILYLQTEDVHARFPSGVNETTDSFHDCMFLLQERGCCWQDDCILDQADGDNSGRSHLLWIGRKFKPLANRVQELAPIRVSAN